MRLPVDAVRPEDITELMRENMQRIDGVSYIQVHPTFLYESLWCAGLLIILFLYRKHKKYEGELFLMYLFGYGAGRVWIERLRTDQLVLPGIGFPVSELLAGCLVIMTGIMLIYCRRHCKKKKRVCEKIVTLFVSKDALWLLIMLYSILSVLSKEEE